MKTTTMKSTGIAVARLSFVRLLLTMQPGTHA